ncbi:MAG: DNA primase [Nitrospirota bacterium]
MKADHLIEEIKSRIDIVDVIGEHVDLKRAGQNYKGLCPFHSEKTPSFMVSPSKQIFHCFGCSKGGDLFTFIMDYESMTFQEALSYLADRAGVKIEQTRSDAARGRGIKENLLAMHKEALHFFRKNLLAAKHALAYLKERGLRDQTIEQFSIGYSTGEKEALFKHLTGQGFSAEHIKASGLVYFKEKDRHDFFRERIMFPIFDLQGRPIAFGGRTLSSSKSVPKYLNSPDNGIFRKGETCYGLHAAKNAIVQKGYTIIVEGYLDALTCHQYECSNTVAPLGTALTSGHLKKLKRFSNKVLLLFDGDSAGSAAAKRSLALLFAEGMVAKILTLPHGEDPDTFLRKFGSDHFKKYMSKATSSIEFLLKTYGKNKLDAVRHALSLITACPDALQKDEALRELSSWSGIAELTLRQELNKTGQKPGGRQEIRLPEKHIVSTISREEKTLLNIIIASPEKSYALLRHLDGASIENPVLRGLFEKLAACIAEKKGAGVSLEHLMAQCTDRERELITQCSIDTAIDEAQIDEMIKGCLRVIALRDIERNIKAAGEAGDVQRLHALLDEKKRISRTTSEGPFL